MNTLTKINYGSLALLFGITLFAIIVGNDFWARFFWGLSIVLFYGIYSQYSFRWSESPLEYMFLFFLIGNIFALFYELSYFSELTLLCWSAGYISLLLYLYKHRSINKADTVFKTFFIGVFIVTFIIVALVLTAFSTYFESIWTLPILMLYFILLSALCAIAFFHFNAVGSTGSLYLLGFILFIALADVLRFLDYYYYETKLIKVLALIIYSSGYLFGYLRMTRNKKTRVTNKD